MTNLSKARLVAILTPVLLLGGALVSQYGFGLSPCEMCMWQRWAHLSGIAPALIAIGLRSHPGLSRLFVLLAALGIAVSGGIGIFHAGVEYHWWEGLTTCSTSAGNGGDVLANIMASPLIRCDVAQWTLGGVSLAGFNAIFSLAGAVVILILLARKEWTA